MHFFYCDSTILSLVYLRRSQKPAGGFQRFEKFIRVLCSAQTCHFKTLQTLWQFYRILLHSFASRLSHFRRFYRGNQLETWRSLKLLIQDVFDASTDFRVELVKHVDRVLNFLTGMKRWPQRCDGKETMKPNLLVSCRLHPFQSLKFWLKLLIVPNNRLVISFLADFVTGSKVNSTDDTNWHKTWSH